MRFFRWLFALEDFGIILRFSCAHCRKESQKMIWIARRTESYFTINTEFGVLCRSCEEAEIEMLRQAGIGAGKPVTPLPGVSHV